jgi:hypothetical protein
MLRTMRSHYPISDPLNRQAAHGNRCTGQPSSSIWIFPHHRSQLMRVLCTGTER